jgi:hypothetical protein
MPSPCVFTSLDTINTLLLIMATLSAAAVAGIVTAVVVTCVVLIVLGYILRSRRRRGRNTVIPYGATPFAPTPFAARPVAATPLTVPSPHVPRFWTGLPQTEGPTFSFGETWSETSVGPRQIFELPGDLPIKDGSNDPWAGWRARNVPRYPVQEFPVPFPEGEFMLSAPRTQTHWRILQGRVSCYLRTENSRAQGIRGSCGNFLLMKLCHIVSQTHRLAPSTTLGHIIQVEESTRATWNMSRIRSSFLILKMLQGRIWCHGELMRKTEMWTHDRRV